MSIPSQTHTVLHPSYRSPSTSDVANDALEARLKVNLYPCEQNLQLIRALLLVIKTMKLSMDPFTRRRPMLSCIFWANKWVACWANLYWNGSISTIADWYIPCSHRFEWCFLWGQSHFRADLGGNLMLLLLINGSDPANPHVKDTYVCCLK